MGDISAYSKGEPNTAIFKPTEVSVSRYRPQITPKIKEIEHMCFFLYLCDYEHICTFNIQINVLCKS